MVVAIVILIIIVAVIYLLHRLKIDIMINLSEDGVYANAICLYPFFDVRIITKDSRPFLIIHILRIRAYEKPLKLNSSPQKRSLLKAIDFENMEVNTYYGFRNPFTTGIFTGLLCITNSLPFPVKINYFPNFFTMSEYFRIDASGYLRLGTTIKNYMLLRKN